MQLLLNLVIRKAKGNNKEASFKLLLLKSYNVIGYHIN
jgi:hypothetical protein